jgi:hypothetical protein
VKRLKVHQAGCIDAAIQREKLVVCRGPNAERATAGAGAFPAPAHSAKRAEELTSAFSKEQVNSPVTEEHQTPPEQPTSVNNIPQHIEIQYTGRASSLATFAAVGSREKVVRKAHKKSAIWPIFETNFIGTFY